MSTDTLAERLKEIKERLSECATWSRGDVSWLVEQLEKVLSELSAAEKAERDVEDQDDLPQFFHPSHPSGSAGAQTQVDPTVHTET